MKVFGKGGGAYDSDYMVAIEDAMVLGADSANLSLGSGNPGFNHISSDTYAAILQRVTESGMVVSISAGNSGSWYENSTNGVAYADGNSWGHRRFPRILHQCPDRGLRGQRRYHRYLHGSLRPQDLLFRHQLQRLQECPHHHYRR